MKYKYTFLTLGLSIIFLSPFLLKLKDPRLEIYPAVLYPTGANLVRTDKSEISFLNTVISDSSKVYNKLEFLDPIPVHYLGEIKESSFGLKKFHTDFKLYKPPIKFIQENQFDENLEQEAKSYWKNKIKSNYFIVKTIREVYNTKTGKFIKSEILNDTVFSLD